MTDTDEASTSRGKDLPSATINASFSADQRTQSSVSFAFEVSPSNSKPARERCESYSTAQSTVIAATTNSLAFSVAEESSEDDPKEVTIMPQDFADKLSQQINRRVELFLEKSPFIRQNSKMEELSRYTRDDLDLGDAIAKGGFSTIVEIRHFRKQILPEHKHQCHNHNMKNPYVIKHLNPALPMKKLPGGGKDLAFETLTLASLNHENIIKIRGWSRDGLEGFKNTRRADGYFIVLDRLGETLFQRIYKWQDKAKRKGDFSKLKRSHYSIQKELFAEKLRCAVDISSALSYCHSKGIMHRGKPNI